MDFQTLTAVFIWQRISRRLRFFLSEVSDEQFFALLVVLEEKGAGRMGTLRRWRGMHASN
jgi:hypothetical protein